MKALTVLVGLLAAVVGVLWLIGRRRVSFEFGSRPSRKTCGPPQTALARGDTALAAQGQAPRASVPAGMGGPARKETRGGGMFHVKHRCNLRR